MEITPDLYEVIVKIVDERVKEIKVTREDFNTLKNSIEDLTRHINELSQAQKRTEERLNELALAQSGLALAQKKTEERLNELALAQKETEHALKELTKQVGRLSDTVGYGIEDIARVVLPSYLQRHYKVKISEPERKFIYVDGKEMEINLYAEGTKGKQKIVMLGEAKSRLGSDDVERFLSNVMLVEQKIKANCLRVMFGFYVHSTAQEIAKPNKIILVASYQK